MRSAAIAWEEVHIAAAAGAEARMRRDYTHRLGCAARIGIGSMHRMGMVGRRAACPGRRSIHLEEAMWGRHILEEEGESTLDHSFSLSTSRAMV